MATPLVELIFQQGWPSDTVYIERTDGSTLVGSLIDAGYRADGEPVCLVVRAAIDARDVLVPWVSIVGISKEPR